MIQLEEAVRIFRDFANTASPSLADHLSLQNAAIELLPHLEKLIETPAVVSLMHCGPQKIQVIKAIREWTGLGLKEAKDLTDRVPVDIPFSNEDTAKRFIRDAEECGAKVSWKGVAPALDQSGIAMEFLHEVRAIHTAVQEISNSLKVSLGPWKITSDGSLKVGP